MGDSLPGDLKLLADEARGEFPPAAELSDLASDRFANLFFDIAIAFLDYSAWFGHGRGVMCKTGDPGYRSVLTVP